MALKFSDKGGVHDRRADAASNAVVPLRERKEFVREITRLCGEVQDKFLSIGRYLNMAKATLPHGEYEAMIANELPIGASAARQLRTVAQAIDGGLLPAERLPSSYSIIYLLATLPEGDRAEADRSGLIRPDVRRSEVIAFKRRAVGQGSASHDALRRERERLLIRLREIDAELGSAVIDIEPLELDEEPAAEQR
jgi:hypothetical protein